MNTKFESTMRNAGWEFFFQLVYVSPISDAVFLLLWLLEKLLVLAPSVMLIFHDTEWDKVSGVARYFLPITYCQSAEAFSVFCYAFFGVVQFGILLSLGRFFLTKYRLTSGLHYSEYSFLSQCVHFFIVFSAKVLLQVCASLLFYVISSFWNNYEYGDYKEIYPGMVDTVGTRYTLAALLAVASLELLVISLVHSLFCQDSSVRNTVPWSPNTFYVDFLMIVVQLLVHANFVLITETNELICFILLFLWLCVIGVIVWYAKWDNKWVDAAEFFYATTLFMAEGLELLCNVLYVMEFSDHYQYAMTIPLYALKLAVIRCVIMGTISGERPKRDKEAVELIKSMIGLAKRRDRAASLKLLMLLCAHSKDCIRTDCECRMVKAKASRDRSTVLRESTRVYITDSEMPERYNDGYLIKALKLLIAELEQTYNKSDLFCITLAEVYFYYFGNYYYAWDQLHAISQRKPSILIVQRMYNLRRSISIGLETGNDEEADPERTCASIDYLKYYHKFIEQAEDSTELTIKFWSVLLKESPSAQELNDFGRKLFESKYNIMKTTECLSTITSNHIEFLIRYGLFMKYVMHDVVSSDEIYKKILYLGECSKSNFLTACQFSLFRTDAKVMFLVASLDNSRNLFVREVNTEFEDRLGFSRKDVIGYSVTNIMPPMIARKHEEFVQRFFQTMQAKNIGQNNRNLRFIKNKDGEYLPCVALKKIVPRLHDGLEVAVFMVPDNRMRKYTRFCREKCCSRFGAILCDSAFRIHGFTKKAVSMLRITERTASELAKNASLQDLFPALEKPDLIAELTANEGRVIVLPSGAIQMDLDKFEETPLDLPPKTIVLLPENTVSQITAAASVVPIGGLKQPPALMWAAIQNEEYGFADPERAHIFIFSLIPTEDLPKYVESPIEGIFEDKNSNAFMAENATIRLPRARSRKIVVLPPEQDGRSEFSVTGSVASVASVSATTKSDSVGKIADQIRIHSVSKQTPSSIKRLAVILALILLGIVGLTLAEMLVSAFEMTDLKDRFELIQMYHLRYKMDVALASMLSVYASNLAKGRTSFNLFLTRTIGRANTLSSYNEQTRKLMYAQGLDYEMDMLTVPDIPSGEREVTFGHSQLIFINNLAECTSYGYYDMVSTCVSNTASSMCKRIAIVNDNDYRSLFYYTRFKQDAVSSDLENELVSLAVEGRSSRYILTGICTGLVLASLLAVTPIFNWVIKDKSYVMAIFSDVEPEEVAKMIEECKKIDIRNVKYRKRWLQKANWRQDAFWARVMTEHGKRQQQSRDGGNGDNPKPAGELGIDADGKNAEDKNPYHPKKMVSMKDPAMGADASIMEQLDESRGAEAAKREGPTRPGHDHTKLAEKEQKEDGEDELNVAMKSAVEKKRRERRKNLSATDSTLRCRAFFRLILVAVLCIAYAAVTFYINYYVHDVNKEAVDIFLALNKRNIFTTLLAIFVKEAQTYGDMTLISANTKNDGKMYMMDVINYMSELERKLRNFQKFASTHIYGRYLSLLDRADSSDFCAVSDSYNYSQTTPCSAYYQGPKDQGLSVAIAYIIDYYSQYANKLLNTNFSDPVAAAAIKSDTGPSVFSPYVASYTSPVQEYLLRMFYADAQSFFNTVTDVEYCVPICFMVMFVAVYIGIFATFLTTLKKEIRETHGVLNMIPMFILESNPRVKEQVINHKQIK
ncbi:MAG: PAS domain S-box protein [Candidatus Pacebacteria bacterium]|nr:PAS domain S-box protein [Candidatus Paceibacterota bacterium]